MNRLSPQRRHAIRCLALIAGVYIVARTIGWTGPDASHMWPGELMYPAIFIITALAVAKLAERW